MPPICRPTHTNLQREILRAQGFTLIEMMVAVVIVAVLTTVAIVGYTRHIRSGRVAEAHQMVAAIQARQEAYRQTHGTYADVSCTGACPGGADADFYPTLASEPQAKPWTSPPAGWQALGFKPEGALSYAAVRVRASNPSTAGSNANHALYGNAAALMIPPQPTAPAAPHAWYYVIAHADLDGNSTYATGGCSGDPVTLTDCTVLTASSHRTEIIVRNERN